MTIDKGGNKGSVTNDIFMESICLVDGKLSRSKELFPGELDNLEGTSVQSYANPELVQRIEPDDETDTYKYIFYYGVGVRIAENKDGDEPNVLVQIEAEFELIYYSEKELEERFLEKFGVKSCSFHVWPYWREYVQNSCSRMGVSPPITLPLFKPENKSDPRPKLHEGGLNN